MTLGRFDFGTANGAVREASRWGDSAGWTSIGEAMITNTLYDHQWNPRIQTGCRCLGSQLKWCIAKIHHQGVPSVSCHDGGTICTAASACIMYYGCKLKLCMSLEASVLGVAINKNVSVHITKDGKKLLSKVFLPLSSIVVGPCT